MSTEKRKSTIENFLLDYSSRGKVRVTGPDRVEFLHAMISHDVKELPEHAGRYAMLLTAQGRIVADFYVYKLPECFLLDLPEGASEKLVSTLERFIIMDDVTLLDESGDWTHLSIQGPQAAAIFKSVLETDPPPEPLQLLPFEFEGEKGHAVRLGRLFQDGVEILLRAADATRLKAVLASHAAVEEMGPDAAEVLRVERGIPAYGRELDESAYPMEARLDHALSLTKGCYIGQEVVAKATHVGGVNRLLCRLRMSGDEIPDAGADLTVEGKKVGKLTSAVHSRRLGEVIGLGYLRRAHGAPGTRVEAELPEGGRTTAEVTKEFSR